VREARERGAVCLLRVDRDSVQLELFVAHGARPAIRPQATLAEALRAIAPIAAEWLVVPPGLDSLEIPGETGEVVILTGADDAAVVAAYGLVKRCVESLDRRESGRTLRRTAPRISVTVLGASDDDVAAVRDKLDKTTRAFLKVDLPVRGGLQRVAPTESAFRGTFDAHAPIVADLFAMIRTAEAAASLDAGATSTEDEAPPIAARAERFSLTSLSTRAASCSARSGQTCMRLLSSANVQRRAHPVHVVPWSARPPMTMDPVAPSSSGRATMMVVSIGVSPRAFAPQSDRDWNSEANAQT
jgi:hypothetical protein